MRQRSLVFKLTAIVVVGALQALGLPAAADLSGARVAGSILAASTQAPLPGARLHLGDPRSGKVFSSAPADAQGGFALTDIPPATYELAVESGGGLYVVQTPLELAPGQSQNLQVAISPLAPGQMAPPPQGEEEAKKKGGASVWNNPVTAALIVVGSAIVIGFLIKEATGEDNEPVSSPS